MEEKTAAQRLGGAFVVGGLIAVVTQVIMLAMSSVLPVKDLVPPVSLVILGLIGMLLVLNGTYAKLNEIGGFGAGIMFCGLVDAVAGVYMGAAMEENDPSAGVKGAIKFAVAILGTLVVVGAVLGVVFAKSAGVLASMAPVTAEPGPIVFLYAFLMGGLISIIGQAMIEFTPLPLPAIILLCGAAGMVMALVGVISKLEVLTGAGLCATVVDAGGGAVLGGATIVLAGTPLRLAILVAVMVLVVIIGIVTGNILYKRAKAA